MPSPRLNQCSECGFYGHNIRTCPAISNSPSTVTCGLCGTPGHNIRTCPQKTIATSNKVLYYPSIFRGTGLSRPQPKPENDNMANEKTDKPNLKTLFQNAMKLDAEIEKRKEEIEQLTSRRSLAVKAIAEAAGNKGPFDVDGRILTIRSREGKIKDEEGKVIGTSGEETWFFVAVSDQQITKI